MTTTAEGTERHDRFTVFLRRLAEIQAYALSGDTEARIVLGEYGLLRWCGYRPEQALAIAENEVREVRGGL